MTRKDVPKIGSPVYQVAVGNIAAGASQQFDLDADTSVHKKYIPFDFIEITNTNADGYELILNDVHRFALPANTCITKSDIPFRRFTINNISANALTGAKMYVSVQHRPLDADKVARRGKGIMDYLPFLGLLGR